MTEFESARLKMAGKQRKCTVVCDCAHTHTNCRFLETYQIVILQSLSIQIDLSDHRSL